MAPAPYFKQSKLVESQKEGLVLIPSANETGWPSAPGNGMDRDFSMADPRPRRSSSLPRILVFGNLAFGLLLAAAPAEPPPLPNLNQKVAEFAESQRGKKVGNGSCVTLAVEALKSANAKRFPLHRADGDYVWGEQVDDVKDALPGDILQFRDAEFKGKKYLTRRRWISWHESYPHHTAIVSGTSSGGKVLTILHQNVGPQGADDAEKQIVQQGTLRMDSLQKGGWVRIYRPIEPTGPNSRP